MPCAALFDPFDDNGTLTFHATTAPSALVGLHVVIEFLELGTVVGEQHLTPKLHSQLRRQTAHGGQDTHFDTLVGLDLLCRQVRHGIGSRPYKTVCQQNTKKGTHQGCCHMDANGGLVAGAQHAHGYHDSQHRRHNPESG